MHGITCHTRGCENENITIVLSRPSPVVICGPCGQQVTDIDPPLPSEPYEIE